MRISFAVPSCIWADKITLVGDFNDWDHRSHPFDQTNDGSWQATLDLPAGSQYEFRYWIDGDWKLDSDADGFSTCSQGIQSGVVNTCLSTLHITSLS